MKEGDRVTGEPLNKVALRKYGTVTGYYEVSEVPFLGKTHKIEYIRIGEISVDCSNIRPASRREKDTVFK